MIFTALPVVIAAIYVYYLLFEEFFYLMAVGGVASVHQLNSQTVAELALKYGLRYSDRLQVGLWKNSWGS